MSPLDQLFSLEETRTLVILAGAAALMLLLLGIYYLRSERHLREGESEEDLRAELDRLESFLRKDPHRDDVWAVYRDLLARLPAAERRRRLGEGFPEEPQEPPKKKL